MGDSTPLSARTKIFDPYCYEFHEDPYPMYSWLRSNAPVYRNEERDFWALSRHADVVEAFRNSDTYLNRCGVSIDPSAWGEDAWRTMSFLARDEPIHGRMRGLVSRAFTPRRVSDLEPRIRQLARAYIDELRNLKSFDFIGDFAGRLPMDVISELVGVPHEDRAELRRLSDLLLHREESTTDVPAATIDAAITLASYYAAMVKARRRSRTNDMTSALIDAEIDGDRLSDDEIIGFLFLMIVAGNETTTKLLGNAWYWAWRFPSELAKVLDEPARVPAWVEETLRFDASTQLIARLVGTDIQLHGVTILAGDRALLLIGSANRDERVFTRPDVYDLDRDPSELQQLVSFGFGRHFCLGASLARLEAQVCLEELVAAFTSYDIDDSRAEQVHSVNVRGFASLPTAATAH